MTYETDEMDKGTKAHRTWIVIFVGLAILFLILGFYKKGVYTNLGSDYSSYNRNAYVGGDAYNLIINASYTVAYFVLAMFSGLTAVGLGICAHVRELLWFQERNYEMLHPSVKEDVDKLIEQS